MSKLRACIDEELTVWIQAQHMFFVATAPLSADGHINCSPKGTDSFRILGPHEVAYLDLTGSSAETAGHLRENGRIVIMFCAFQDKPWVLRLHGIGEVVTEGHPEWEELLKAFPYDVGARAIIRIKVARVATYCGLTVPLFEYKGERDGLQKWADATGAEGLREYRRENNAETIDGLPALE